MTDTVVTLGGVVFDGWGVPEHVNGGGAQKQAVHRLIGGARIIDALGWDADAIKFSGRFRGLGAMANVRLLEVLARSGSAVTFSYWSCNYQVVVARFAWRFERFNEITYDVALTVLSDLTQDGVQAAPPTLDELFDGDATLLSDAAVPVPALGAALSAVSAARDAVGVLQGAQASSVSPLAGCVAAALGFAQVMQTAADAEFPAALGAGAGSDPTVLAATLNAQNANMLTLTALVQSTALLTRMQVNLQTAAT